MMFTTTSSTNSSSISITSSNAIEFRNHEEEFTDSPSWKLYENPFYMPRSSQHHQEHHVVRPRKIHDLPLSARKIAASVWGLSFYTPAAMEDARSRMIELKAELEFERRVRKKLESSNRRMAKDLAEERRAREGAEGVYAREISELKAEMEKMKREMDEERKMLRMAEVFREERVQMKLREAKLLYEEKLVELDQQGSRVPLEKPSAANLVLQSEDCLKNRDNCDGARNEANTVNKGLIVAVSVQRKASPEPENPHIKRGIKGFVEFPRVVKAIGSRNTTPCSSDNRDVKAQLRILLKHKTTFQSSSPIIS